MVTKIGVDTGGTFSDFMLMDGDTLVIHKVLSTPDNPARAVLQGLRHLRPGLTSVVECLTPSGAAHGGVDCARIMIVRRQKGLGSKA